MTNQPPRMFQPRTMMDDECSPWPPVLQFTPEVTSGIQAATELAFGPNWDTPMCELDAEVIAHDLLRYAPALAMMLLDLGSAQ